MDNKTEEITEAERSKRRREKNRASTEHSNTINNPCAKVIYVDFIKIYPHT